LIVSGVVIIDEIPNSNKSNHKKSRYSSDSCGRRLLSSQKYRALSTDFANGNAGKNERHENSWGDASNVESANFSSVNHG